MGLTRYPSYKPSGIVWIGEIPSHWEMIRFASLGTFSKGRGIKKDEIREFGLPCIRYGEIYTKYHRIVDDLTSFIDEQSASGSARIKSGDILFAGSGETVEEIGKAVVYAGRKVAYASGDIIILSLSDKLNPGYASFLANAHFVQHQKSVSAKGEIIVHIYPKDIREIVIPLPSPSEQTAIAAYLDEKTAQIDKLIASKKRMIELLREERQAVINEAVNGEGKKGWERKKLKYVATIRYGLGQPPRQLDGGLPLIRATNVNRGKIEKKDIVFVDPDDVPYERNPILRENEIIVVRSGAYTADSAIVPKEFDGAISGYDMVVSVKLGNPKYVAYVLLSNDVLVNQLQLQSLRAAQPHLNKEELGETLLYFPSYKIQDMVVSTIETESQRVEDLISRIEHEFDLLLEYRTSLINAAVTGKLKVS